MYRKVIILIFYFISFSFFEVRSEENHAIFEEGFSEVNKGSKNEHTDQIFALNCPSNIIQSVTSACEKSVSWPAPTSDNTDVVEIISIPASGSLFRLGQTTVEVQGKNSSGDIIETCSFTVTLNLSNPYSYIFPDVQCAPSQTITLLNSCNRTVSWTEPTSPCSEITFTKTAVPGITQFNIGENEVFYRANLNGVEIASCSFTITLVDNIPPVFESCPSNITLDANEDCQAVADWTVPEASDNCGFAPNLTTNFEPGSIFPIGTTEVVYTATDEGGNTVECSFDVIVEDNTAPEFLNAPTEIRISANEICQATPTWTEISAVDNCSADVTINSNFSSGEIFDLGETVVEYTAEDEAGNVQTTSFNVIVEDDTAPALDAGTCPTNITVSAATNCEGIATWDAPTFSDNCNNFQISSSHDSGDAFPFGDTQVTYKATDASGNQSLCSFTVTVEDDTAPQILEQPDDIFISAANDACEASVTWDEIIAEDNCSEQLSIATNFNSGDLFPLGESVVEISVKDESDNETISSFKITVEDNTGPEVRNCPSDITVSAVANCQSSVNWIPPSFLDNCDSDVTLTSSHEPRAQFPVGITVVSYTATDNAGNTSTCSFNVIVEDDVAPLFTNCIADILLSANDDCEQIVEWVTPVVSDNCDPEVNLESDFTSGDSFPVGTTLVTYTAADEAGNTSVCSFNVVIEDKSAPLVSFCPDDLKISTAENCVGMAQWDEPVFEDCSNLDISSNWQLGDELPVGFTTIEYTATDENGLVATCSFEVEVLDQTVPEVLNCVEDITVSASDNCNAIVEWEEPTANDNCSTVIISSNYESGSSFPFGITTVEYEFTDEEGNSSFCIFDVNVIDESELIVSNCPENIVIRADNNTGTTAVTWEEPTATTACSDIVVNASHEPGSSFDVGTTIVRYNFTTEAGKSSECSFEVTVEPILLEINFNKLMTPNGDGNNDSWIISGIENFPDNEVIIVDRWGTEIFSAQGYNNEEVVWKGENRGGELVPRGTYYYFISVRNDQDGIQRKGFLEVLR
ncbi:gliding motility-associated C-terminal domain-containing protein [Marivirga sericea]|uniref:Gliding motility-associated C-terminal domain-containing protein n=1 Tax=Marivirga sericea TaxID=1028 RepID=A0A1X7IFK9_9BACT|nr:HYR domain-containing protein [Marivirga sericea]SMG13027.1 gliding motility-associated C-terminal domain-containing protein [Marivirga sericea]